MIKIFFCFECQKLLNKKTFTFHEHKKKGVNVKKKKFLLVN